MKYFYQPASEGGLFNKFNLYQFYFLLIDFKETKLWDI